MPDSPSVQAYVTVTSALYQPRPLAARFAFGARSAAAVIAGSVLSMLTSALSVAVLPALSVAVPVTVWSSPSVEITLSAVHEAMPEVASAQTNFTVTFVRFQPLAFASGDCVWLIVGDVPSILTVTVLCASALPALSTLQYSSECVPSPLIATLVPLCIGAPSRM